MWIWLMCEMEQFFFQQIGSFVFIFTLSNRKRHFRRSFWIVFEIIFFSLKWVWIDRDDGVISKFVIRFDEMKPRAFLLHENSARVCPTENLNSKEVLPLFYKHKYILFVSLTFLKFEIVLAERCARTHLEDHTMKKQSVSLTVQISNLGPNKRKGNTFFCLYCYPINK